MSGAFEQFYGADSKFVYYNDLQNTYPSIYNSLKANGTIISGTHSSKMNTIASTLYGWAAQEAIKEIELLKQYFNVGTLALSPDQMYTSVIGRQIVYAMNTSMQLKSVYERHLTRILGPGDRGRGTAKITGAQFFAEYFADELGKIVTRTYEGLTNITDYRMEQLGEILFSEANINEALHQTFFVRMKNSGDWSGSDANQGYQELFTAIENFNKDNFLRQVSQAYRLDELKQRLQQDIQSQQQLQSIISGGRSKMKKTMKSSLGQTTTAKGTLAEIFAEQGFAAVAQLMKEQIPQLRDTNSKVIGGAGGKADIVTTFGLDFSAILPTVEQHYANRAQTVAAYKQLNSYLANLKQGFVVYTNAKDYSLIRNTGKGYSFGGFSAGSAISLDSLESVIANTPGGSQTIIGQIMSTMDGAVYSDLKDDLEEELCEKMAYFLFDDVLTIGKDTKAAGHVIHLLMLDGVYIPLSYLFFLMARAIEDVNQDPDDIFKITIEPGKIKYEEGPWEPGMWADQKQIAYSQIKIGATFLKNFVDVVREMRMA